MTSNHKKEESPIYFIFHIPKTAGTTIRHHLGKNLGEIFLAITKNKSEDYLSVEQYTEDEYFKSIGKEGRYKIKVLMGHILNINMYKKWFKDRPLISIVTVRDPFETAISFFNHQIIGGRIDGKINDKRFIKWLKKSKDFYKRHIEDWDKSKNAKKILSEFDLIIDNQTFEKDLAVLCDKLNIQNKIEDSFNVTAQRTDDVYHPENFYEVQKIFNKLNKKDLELYEYIKSRS